MNYYEILQVSNHAEIEVIDAAYKRLSLKYHPDKNNSPDANQRMQEINEAYSILSQKNSREEYDYQLSRIELNNEGAAIAGRVLKVVEAVTHIPAKKILQSDKIGDDLNCTSESIQQLVNELKREFVVEFAQDYLNDLPNYTVGDIINSLKNLYPVKNRPNNHLEKNSGNNGGIGEFLTGLFKVGDEILGERCPYCGVKSRINQEWKSQSIFEVFTGEQRVRCRNCGNTFTV